MLVLPQDKLTSNVDSNQEDQKKLVTDFRPEERTSSGRIRSRVDEER